VTPVSDFRIRPYAPADRARVRHICFVTGYIGEPVEWQWRDAESFANIFTGYYTDAEPESALVAEIDGEVRGYLLGCVDSSRPGTRGPSSAARSPAAASSSVRHSPVRLALPGRRHRRCRPQAPSAGSVLRPRWPAHLHIDLLRDARGRGVGAALMRRWIDRLVEAASRAVIWRRWPRTGGPWPSSNRWASRSAAAHAGARPPLPPRRASPRATYGAFAPGRVCGVTSRRKLVKPALAGIGLFGTIASIWWFALKPRRARAKEE